jgi:hypothetical protein
VNLLSESVLFISNRPLGEEDHNKRPNFYPVVSARSNGVSPEYKISNCSTQISSRRLHMHKTFQCTLLQNNNKYI